MGDIKYSNTSAHLYEDIALWEKTEGKRFLKKCHL